jgi:uncharacterized membrane protein (DUF4010 family)
MELLEIFKKLGIALGLGLLVGLQRERTDARLAGFRTFPLITILGALSGLLGEGFGGWVIGLGLVGLTAIIVVGNLEALRAKNEPSGVTSEAALLVMYAVGAYLMVGHSSVAIAIGGTVAVLLHLKPEMHALAAKILDRDFKAIMQFALISLVILPILPNEYYGPYRVLNPFKIWLMVVLIVGISLGGYITYKILGPRAGTWAAGVLGGLISSTATTVSYSRRSKEAPKSHVLATFVILAASAIVFLRVLILVGATAPAFLRDVAVPMGVMFGTIGALSVRSWLASRTEAGPMPAQSNPTELKPAIIFALLFTVILVGVAAAKNYFGSKGLYAVAVLSGLADMDAITVSITQLVNTQTLPASTGWRLILVASMSNLVFKAGVVALLGDRKLFFRVAGSFAVAFAVGVLILLFWPAPE